MPIPQVQGTPKKARVSIGLINCYYYYDDDDDGDDDYDYNYY